MRHELYAGSEQERLGAGRSERLAKELRNETPERLLRESEEATDDADGAHRYISLRS